MARPAHSPSGLADDARKVAQALEPFAKSPDVNWQVHQARHLWPIAESLPGKIEALERERDEAVADRAVGLTVGGGLLVYGSEEAILRAQTYVLLDSKHPQETKDTNRLLARALQAAESQLAEMTKERDDARTKEPNQ